MGLCPRALLVVPAVVWWRRNASCGGGRSPGVHLAAGTAPARCMGRHKAQGTRGVPLLAHYGIMAGSSTTMRTMAVQDACAPMRPRSPRPLPQGHKSTPTTLSTSTPLLRDVQQDQPSFVPGDLLSGARCSPCPVGAARGAWRRCPVPPCGRHAARHVPRAAWHCTAAAAARRAAACCGG